MKAVETNASALVTGASGFIGLRTAKLLRSGYRVIVNGRRSERLGEISDVDAVFGDLNDEAVIKELQSKKPDFVVHCAGLSTLWATEADYHKANVEAVKRVCELCVDTEARLVHLSTPSIYVDKADPTRELLDIDETYRPSEFATGYAASKWQGEQVIEKYISDFGLKAVILRPQAVIGHGDNAIVPRLERIVGRNRIPLFNRGETLIEVTHVNNVAQAIEQSMSYLSRSERPEQVVFNVTNGDPRSVKSLLALYLAAVRPETIPKFKNVPKKPIRNLAKVLEGFHRTFNLSEPAISVAGIDLLSASRTLDISMAKKVLGYDPSLYSVEMAINEY